MLTDIENSFTVGFSKEFAIKCCHFSRYPLTVSNSILRKSSFYMDTNSETITPLFCDVTLYDALLKAMPAIPHVGPFTL